MSTKVFHIQSKNRTAAHTIANIQDFEYVEGENIDSKIIIENPNITLYCLDPQNQRLIFVETPLHIDLSQAPFFYEAQYEYAERLFAVPFEDINQLVEEIGEPIEQLVLIYSVGRCGSTLLSKVFNQVDTVVSLSEPDIFSQIVGIRNPDGSNDNELTALLRSCIYLVCKPTLKGKSSYCVLKFRSIVIEIGDLIYRAFPQAQVIFLYRNAEAVVKSSMRAFVYLSSMLPTIQQNIEFYSRFIPLLKDYASDIDFTDSQATDLYTTMWLSTMQRYLSLYEQGVASCAIRYEDLVADPQQIVTSIFERCGLPISEVSNVCKVFEKDSQSGSNLSRENTAQNDREQPNILEISQKVNQLLKKHPQIKTPDFLVPGTLSSAR